jgi:hypothetical protein
MRIVTLDAVANGRGMDGAFQRRRVFIGVAGDAQLLRSRRDELYAGDVLIDAHFMAAHTAHGDGGVDELALGLLLVAFQTLGRVDVFVQGNRVNGGSGSRKEQRDQSKQDQNENSKRAIAMTRELFMKPHAMRELSQSASGGCMCTTVTVSQKNC